MNAVGMNTDNKTRTSPTIGPWSSTIAFSAACRGVIFPSSTILAQSSTTTMASSTTIAMASTSPNRVRVLRVNPSSFITANVAISDTGIVIIGMITALQLCRNRRITNITISVVSANVTSTSSIDAETKLVVFISTRQLTPSGRYRSSSSSFCSTSFATARALASERW